MPAEKATTTCMFKVNLTNPCRTEEYSEPCRTSKMELFRNQLTAQKAPSQIYEIILNTPTKELKFKEENIKSISNTIVFGFNGNLI